MIFANSEKNHVSFAVQYKYNSTYRDLIKNDSSYPCFYEDVTYKAKGFKSDTSKLVRVQVAQSVR
jgi:hypothetical protein